MKITITIHMDNAAFNNDDPTSDDNAKQASGAEVARILRQFSLDIEGEALSTKDSWNLRDINGNTVGAAVVTRSRTR